MSLAPMVLPHDHRAASAHGALERRAARHRNPRTVVSCYAVFDKFFPTVGLLDYTEGIYLGNPATPFDQAQRNQIEYVLDEAGVTAGTRMLEIGCGNGNLLDQARDRGARGIGITISPEQVALCRRRGLDARLINYRDLDAHFQAAFDTVVLNGPIEHFVQPDEALDDRGEAIYREMFAICRRMLDPASPVRRMMNTTIHFVRPPDPHNLLRHPRCFPPHGDAFHWAMLHRSFGGWYPAEGQFARCARGTFQLQKEVDGTQDYHWTSETWLRRIRAELRSLRALTILRKSLPLVVQYPQQLFTMLNCMLRTESWNWQFRGPHAPTKLLRQTWQVV